MSRLEASAAALFDWGTQTSWQVALLVAVVAGIQQLFGRWLSPRGRYALWLLVAVRLALPALPELRFALVPWTAQESSPVGQEAPRRTALPALALPPSGGRASRTQPAAAGTEPTTLEDAETAPLVPARIEAPGSPPEPRPREMRLEVLPVAAPEAPAERAAFARTCAVFAWLLVAGLLLLRDAACEWRFRRALRRLARPVTDPRVLRVLSEARAALGVGRGVALLRYDALSSPALSGFLRPRILLPDRALRELTPEQLAGVLRHELAHVRRGDVLTNLALVVLRRLWWFHPFVHLAFARLRSAQEAARDAEALSGERSPAPLAYARTLLALAEGVKPAAAPGVLPFLRAPSDTKRRILMSIDFHPPRLAQGLLGALLLSSLGWLSLTSASTPARIERPASNSQGSLRSVIVERHHQPPAWREQLEERLEMLVTVDAEEAPVQEIVTRLRQLTELNFVVQMEAFDDMGVETLSMQLENVPVRTVLDRLCDWDDLGWCLTRGAVSIGWQENLSEELDLRFYKVAPLLEGVPEDEREDALDRMTTLIQETTQDQNGWAWERNGVWIETWDDLIAIHQSDAVHARTLAFLNRMLNRGREPERTDERWREPLERALETSVSVDFEGAGADQVIEALATQTGVRIHFEPDFLEDWGTEELSLQFSGMSLRNALGWVAQLTGSRVRLLPGEIVLGRELDSEVVFYDVGDLFGSVHDRHDEELRDRVEETMRNMVMPESWDESPACMITDWRDQLIVVQSAEAQAQVAALLDAVRRATRP